MTEEKGKTLTVVGENDGTVQVDNEDLRQEVIKLRDKADESYWAFGIALAEVYSGDKYRAWGFQTWKEYVERELDFDIRTIQYLFKLQLWFETVTPSIAKWVRGLGWTKARMLMHVVTKENAAEWKKRVDGKTVKEIQDILDGKKRLEDGGEEGEGSGSGGGSGEKGKDGESGRKRSWFFYSGQDRLVSDAIERAKTVAETDNEGHALTLICTDYLATNADTMNKDDMFKNLERTTGLLIVAVRESDGEEEDEIVYGGDYVNKEMEKLSSDAPKDSPERK